MFNSPYKKSYYKYNVADEKKVISQYDNLLRLFHKYADDAIKTHNPLVIELLLHVFPYNLVKNKMKLYLHEDRYKPFRHALRELCKDNKKISEDDHYVLYMFFSHFPSPDLSQAFKSIGEKDLKSIYQKGYFRLRDKFMLEMEMLRKKYNKLK